MSKDFWAWLKPKCLNCYKLNKGTKPDGIELGLPNKAKMLVMKYCPKHKKEIKELRDWIVKYG